MTLQERIAQLVAQHGSLRAVARVAEIDVGYLSRLRSGEKAQPQKDKLRRLGLRRVVLYELLAAAPQAEPSRSQKMREAGFTPRDTRLTCDECGEKFTRQFAPLHECAPQAEPAADYPCRNDGRCQYAIDHGAEGLGHCPKGKCSMPPEPAVTEAMVTAYLTANDAYWKRIDGEPTKLGKWRNGTPSEATRVSLEAALASAPHAREPLNFDRLQSVMAAHFGGRELTDDEADSAEEFARAIERAHGIGA